MEINILTYICGLTGYYISESVATNIALKRGVLNVTTFEELSERDIDLLEADVIFSLALRPPKTSSWSIGSNTSSSGSSHTETKSHGGFTHTTTSGDGSSNSNDTQSRGSEETGDITDLLEHGCHLYEKWNEPIPCYVLKKIEKSKRGLSWL